ncbi:hypothetical protein C8Q74DRAFT_1290321 [Fomes fomentarius]|nr:hypothetical protein C8Q74DRAFT_1290321 [Fomes fomentarius]
MFNVGRPPPPRVPTPMPWLRVFLMFISLSLGIADCPRNHHRLRMDHAFFAIWCPRKFLPECHAGVYDEKEGWFGPIARRWSVSVIRSKRGGMGHPIM